MELTNRGTESKIYLPFLGVDFQGLGLLDWGLGLGLFQGPANIFTDERAPGTMAVVRLVLREGGQWSPEL